MKLWAAALHESQLPLARLPEIAMCGRSNSGKSTLAARRKSCWVGGMCGWVVWWVGGVFGVKTSDPEMPSTHPHTQTHTHTHMKCLKQCGSNKNDMFPKNNKFWKMI